MKHPGAEQINASIRDFERALDPPLNTPFAPEWWEAEFKDDDTNLLFDPGLNPTLYEKSWQIKALVHRHCAKRKALYHHPFLPDEGNHSVDLTGDGDVLAVFVSDVNESRCDVYVLSDWPRGHTENLIQTPWPQDILRGRYGQAVVRLADRYGSALLHNADRTSTCVEGPGPLASPARKFLARLHYGTDTTGYCDLKLDHQQCDGPTILIPQDCGTVILLWEVCEACYRTASETVCASYATAEPHVSAARWAVG